MGVSVKRIVVTGMGDCQPAGLRRTARLAVAAGRKVRDHPTQRAAGRGYSLQSGRPGAVH